MKVNTITQTQMDSVVKFFYTEAWHHIPRKASPVPAPWNKSKLHTFTIFTSLFCTENLWLWYNFNLLCQTDWWRSMKGCLAICQLVCLCLYQ